ncbi:MULTISPECIES: SRPBCC family protein [Bacillaceae]|uniref:SRPBCC family protein n=1 Tax=Bacillaceae TaxID=186817 RepID=UPI000C79245C|nr:hypothetical protein CYJ36_06690 [Bacillus sp. UMB0893]
MTFNWSPTNKYKTEVSITFDKSDEGTVVTVTETGYLIEDADVCLSCATGWGEALTFLKMYIEFGITTNELKCLLKL